MNLLSFLTLSIVASAQLALPPNDGFFTETVDFITIEQEESLERALSDIADQTGQFIIVLVLDGIYKGDATELAKEVHQEWDLPNSSVLLLIGYEDRRATIQPGSAFSELFPSDIVAGIVETDILPKMREGEYGLAVLDGIEGIMKHLSGQYTSERYADIGSVSRSMFVILLYAIVALFGLSWIIGTVILFKTHYKFSIAGTLIGPIVGVLLLEKYGMWLSIPPFVLIGVACDYAVLRLYKQCLPSKKKRRRR